MKRIFRAVMAAVLVLLAATVSPAEVLPRHGVQRQYYEDGTPKFLWKYKNSKVALYRAYYRNGRVSLERRYKNGRLVLQRKYYENGHLESEWDCRVQKMKVYSRDGRLRNTVDRKPEGGEGGIPVPNPLLF